MKRIACLVAAIGLLAQVGTAHAVGVGLSYSGNTEGAKAYENVPDQLKDLLLGKSVTSSGGSGGTSLDLRGLKCLPEYLVIKGGPGYVVLGYAEYSSILKDGIVKVSDTCLLNPGGQVPTISHWEGRGCKSVPEPTTALASMGVILVGALMSRRVKKSRV